MTITSITYVTSIIKIFDDLNHPEGSIESRIQNFILLAKTGIPLLIYISSEYLVLLEPYLEIYPNLKIGKVMELKDTFVSKVYDSVLSSDKIELPERRSEIKDTTNNILLTNAKIEFVKNAVLENPFGSTHFAWIDFNIFHMFKRNPSYAAEVLKTMSTRTFQTEDFLILPGCWDYNWGEPYALVHKICWRFCGSFFLGSAKSILDFNEVYETRFRDFLAKHKVLTWEVNFWSAMESEKQYSPIWYKADHNESIFDFTADICSSGIEYTKSVRYNYPYLEEYVPTSMSHFYDNANRKHVLNTRFVNYTILPDGCYMIRNVHRHLYTRNMASVFDENIDFGELNSVTELTEMREKEELQNYPGAKYFGLEDIRLYQLEGDNKIRFVSSNTNHVPNLKIRICSGVYDIATGECSEFRVLHPPTDTWCEKNWIPLPKAPVDEEAGEYFVYKWMPFEIGRLDDTDQLHIVKSYAHNTPFWRGVRGSSVPIETNDGYLCVVHFSEEKSPRHYFHLLVLLDKETYKPLKYSRFFYFHKKSVEFCIGFSMKDCVYQFWISNFDRDPEYLEVPCSAIDLCYDIIYVE